jgi:N-carbamoyl-L-amino-acid hydrolase
MSFTRLWESLLPVGRDAHTGGYRRYTWTEADLGCRAWFRDAAAERQLPVTADGNGNLWAWWDPPGHAGPRVGAIVTGSHLDSVPDGGAFDGPLGVVSGFAAVDLLRERGRAPVRPLAVAAFCEEEGARFGVACLGSRLLTGVVTPEAARALRDGDGITLAQAMTTAGQDPGLLGPDEDLLAGLAAFVELHVEQGRALADPPCAAIGIAEGIWPHGRWRFEFTGRADHAGTARLPDRADPMLPFAATVLAARQAAQELGTLATFGKVTAEPGGVNAVSSRVRAWLDARAPDEAALQQTVARIQAAAEEAIQPIAAQPDPAAQPGSAGQPGSAAARAGVSLSVTAESATPLVTFDPALRDRLAATLTRAGIQAPVLPTGAGHDAGVLASRIPTAMLFVRNPTGVSHAPGESADLADCERGVEALAAVLDDLACQ